jgi:hypothetical protein
MSETRKQRVPGKLLLILPLGAFVLILSATLFPQPGFQHIKPSADMLTPVSHPQKTQYTGTDMYHLEHNRISYVGDSYKLLLNADPRTFAYLGDGYAKDAKHVFILGHVLQNGVDPKTFETLGGLYATDARQVYWGVGGDRVPRADPKTFERVGRFLWQRRKACLLFSP